MITHGSQDENGERMRAGQGFGRWGFILGNVLIAFGAPVFVTSLVAAVAAGRASTPARGQDVAAIAAGAVFMIAGLVATVVAGRVRQVPTPSPQPEQPAAEPQADRTPAHAIEWPSPLPLTLNTLDDYYARSDGDLALADGDPYGEPYSAYSEPYGDPYHAARPVPRPRNARVNMNGERFCEPSATPITGTRSNGSRRRPQGG